MLGCCVVVLLLDMVSSVSFGDFVGCVCDML